MSDTRFTRRGVLRSGLAASVSPLLSRTILAEDGPKGPPGASSPKTFLLVDWFHVKKGELQVVLDEGRVTDDGRKILDTYKTQFGKRFETGTHGFRPIDVPSGVRIVPETARRSGPWLNADQPWEENIGCASVLHDEGRYRCWYRAKLKGKKPELTFDQGRGMEIGGGALAYAESADGRNWIKPKRTLIRFEGADTNLLSPHGNGGIVFRDDHGDAGERYKSWSFDELPKDEIPRDAKPHQRYGLYAVVSPDGHRWTRKPAPSVRYFSDTFNIAGWDPGLGKYVGYFRHHLGGRAISRSETEDFGNWPQPTPLLAPGPLDAPADDYYTSGYTAYPGDASLRLLFPAIYHHDDDSVDVRLAVSRDGRAFQWISHDPVVRLGGAGEWDGGSLYAHPSLLRLPDGKLALPYQASKLTHNEVFFRNFYRDYPGATGFGWAIWDDARLAGVQADHFGSFTTNSAPFVGDRIEINARTTRAGSVEVELREAGRPLDGFSFEDCVPFGGDETWTPCRWKGKDDLSALKGKNLELGFRLRSAKIFAYRFS